MQVIPITNLSEEWAAPYAQLPHTKVATADEIANVHTSTLSHHMICESLYVIKLAAKLGLTFNSLLIDERHLERVQQEVSKYLPQDTLCYTASRSLLSQLVGFEVTRGYFACVRRPATTSFNELICTGKTFAVLDNLVDVTNVGALFRNAAALGIDGVILSPFCPDPLNRRSMRVSMGTVLQIPWTVAPHPWPAACFEAFSNHGIKTLGFALDANALPLQDLPLSSHTARALFFGTEGEGLSPQVLRELDTLVTIPMQHGVDSLNVAASSAIAFWELGKHS